MNNDYKTEVCERWGNTDAYREHAQKTKNYTKEKWAEANDGLMAIFAEFAACKCRFCRSADTCCQASGAYHRQLLHLHRRDPLGSWQDVRCRRTVQEEHRQVWRWSR